MDERVFVLPDLLESLSDEDKKGVLALLTLVCSSDGELVREEMAALEAKMGQALMHPETRREVRQMLRQPPLFDEVINQMSQEGLKLATRDALLIAASDGEYHDKELFLIKKIAVAAGLEDAVIEKLLAWVNDCWVIQARGRAIIGTALPGDEEVLKLR